MHERKPDPEYRIRIPKTRITIFIDTDILDWFRDEAECEGHGYQTEINQALRNYIKQDKRPIQDVVREAVRKEIRTLKKAKLIGVLENCT